MSMADQTDYLSFMNILMGWGLEQFAGSVLGLLSCVMQRRRFDPPLRRIFLVEGIFPLELTCVQTPFPQHS